MPAVSNNPSNNPDGNENKKVLSNKQETMAQRKEREEEAERRKKLQEDKEIRQVTTGVMELIKEAKLPAAGLLRVHYINGYKFRANYYVDHSIVWTKCVTIGPTGVVAVCQVQ